MQHTHRPESLDILGVPVDAFVSYWQAEELIVRHIRDKRKTFCAAISSGKIYLAQQDSGLRHVLRSADLHICDGMAVVLAALVLHRQRVRRITGVQLFWDLIRRAEKDGLKVFLLGARPASNEGTYKRLLEMHPRLQVVGRQDGYFQEDEETVRRINQSEADMLFVALGSPRQEQWIHTHHGRLDASFCMGVGGTFDVVSGHAHWAPAWVRRLGMEWMYRTMREPRARLPRLGRDVLFGLKVLQAALGRR
jgi:N-acetylglucosaminyldiphosphoundecaprenol N-acetyl-beta-D-mannosaminyltransferase